MKVKAMDMLAKAALFNVMSEDQRRELATLEFEIQKQVLLNELNKVKQ